MNIQFRDNTGDEEFFFSLEELEIELVRTATPDYTEKVLSSLKGDALSVSVHNGNLIDTYTVAS